MIKLLSKTIWPLIKSYKFSVSRILLILVLLGLFESISLALLPISLSFFVDDNAINTLPSILTKLFNNFSSQRIGIIFSIFIIFSYIFKNILSILAASNTTRFACLIRDNWRIKILNNYLKSNIFEINSPPTGVVIENISTQTETAAKFIKTFVTTTSYLIISLSLIISLFITSSKITLIAGFIFISIGLMTSFPLKNAASKIGRKNLKYRQLISKSLNDYFIGILQVKIFNIEKKIEQEIWKKSRLQSEFAEKTAILSNLPNLIGAIALISILIIVFISSWNRKSFNITQIATFILVSQKLQAYIGNLLQSYTSLGIQKSSFDLVQNLLKESKLQQIIPEIDNIKNKTKINEIRSIQFKNVSFSYSRKDSIIKETNFNLKKGDLIYIIGESGSGKSTIVNLVCGLIQKYKGEIKINNNSIKKIDLTKYTSKISYVSQDNFLFNDSIFNNLCLGNKEISEEWIIKCCKLAGAHKFINNLADGYQTNVGERGFTLSGGQIQRICIARAFIKNGDLMIFDEATSALDKNNEKLIFDAIKKFAKSGKIIIVISHKIQSNIENSKKLFLQSRNIS